MPNTKTGVTFIVTGALGAEFSLTDYLALMGVMTRKSESMQQTAALGSVHILKKVLFITAYWSYADG